MRHAAGWLRVPDNAAYVALWAAHNPGSPAPVMWQKGPVRALVGRETWAYDGSTRWHISASCEDRVPTWDELVTVAHDLRPGVAFCMGVPPRSWWLNVHPNVLHLWETRDDGLIAEWRANAQGHAPT